ncbi:glycoside hydrolase family protein [Litorimonas sp.]|uniref:lysozyme n=1 Tax=Litorimonas sp. TaxID=1892381 RepID=UPI003A86F2A3
MSALIPDWKAALKSYSFIGYVVAIVVYTLPAILLYYFDTHTNPYYWGWLLLAVLVLGLIGRFINQPDSHKGRRRVIIVWLALAVAGFAVPALASPYCHGERSVAASESAEFDSLAVPLIGKWEGLRLTAYHDTLAKPPIWTVCFGATRVYGRSVRPYEVFTREECERFLSADIDKHRSGFHKCVSRETKRRRFPVTRDVAFTSLAYNIGVFATCRSTALKRLNAGNVNGACDAMTWYDKAGNVILRGLVRRRSEEREYCLMEPNPAIS